MIYRGFTTPLGLETLQDGRCYRGIREWAEGCDPEVGQWLAWSLHSVVVTGWNVSFLIGFASTGQVFNLRNPLGGGRRHGDEGRKRNEIRVKEN